MKPILPKLKRGGQRLFAEPMRRVLVMLDRASIERAQKLGDGNVSAGIRKALASPKRKANG